MLERDKIVPFLKKYNREDPLNVIFYGPPGTGKSSMARQLKERGQMDYTITFTSEQSAAVMTGYYIPQGDHFEYLDGIGVRAMKGEPVEVPVHRKKPELGTEVVHMGGLLIIDEIDKASPDMLDILYEIGNDRRIARIFLPDGTIVRPREGYQVIGTMNGLPDDLPDAIRDRFPICIPVWKPGDGQLNTLSKAVRQVCDNLYESVQGTGLSPKFTFRTLRAFDRMVTQGAPVNLAATVVTDSSEEAVALVEAYTLEDEKIIATSLQNSLNGNGKLPDGVIDALTAEEDPLASIAPIGSGILTLPDDDEDDALSGLGPAGVVTRKRRRI